MPRWLVCWCAAALAVHVALLVHAAWVLAPTADEPAHLAAGVSHWQRGTFELYRPNPPLARMLAALPALAGPLATDYRHVAPLARSEWFVGQDFIAANGAPAFARALFRARLAGVLWSVLGALLVAAWARALWGHRAAALAIALWCVEPTILGHAPLVTPDVPAAVAGFAATCAYWRFLRRPTWARCGLAGALLGIALLTKLTMLVLFAAWPLIGRPRPLHALALIVASLVVLNGGYGCTGALPRLGALPFHSRAFAGELAPPPAPVAFALPVRSDGTIEAPAQPPPHAHDPQPWNTGNRFAGTWLGAVILPLPADFVRGLDAQQADFEAHLPSYLRGERRDHGWWYYYLYAALVKLPLGLLLLGGWAAVLAPRTRALVVPALVIFIAVSSQTGFNHHFRYVLPAFPFAIALVARLGVFVSRATPRRAVLVIAATLATAASSLAQAPRSLSYFNELAGGPAHGDRHLVDSNLDWGQDLYALAAWLRAYRPADPLALAYFGALDPRLLGIRYAPPPAADPQPGFYAISVNYLHGVRYPIPDGTGGRRDVALDDFTYFAELDAVATVGTSIRLYCVDRAAADRLRARRGLPPTTRGDPACSGHAGHHGS